MVGAHGIATRPSPQRPSRPAVTVWQTAGRMLRDVMLIVAIGLTFCLLLKPLLLLLLALIAGTLCWLIARIGYWLVSLVPIWINPESQGRLHRWPVWINALICLFLCAAIWWLLHAYLSSALQIMVRWLVPGNAATPPGMAQVVAVVDALWTFALRVIAGAVHGVAELILPASWSEAVASRLDAWHTMISYQAAAFCAVPAMGSQVPADDLAPGLFCHFQRIDFYGAAVMLLLVAACLVLFYQRTREAARLRGIGQPGV